MNGSESDRRFEKQALREQLNREIAQYLARGGQIKSLESQFRPTHKKTAYQSLWQRGEAGLEFQQAQ